MSTGPSPSKSSTDLHARASLGHHDGTDQDLSKSGIGKLSEARIIELFDRVGRSEWPGQWRQRERTSDRETAAQWIALGAEGGIEEFFEWKFADLHERSIDPPNSLKYINDDFVAAIDSEGDAPDPTTLSRADVRQMIDKFFGDGS